MLDRIEYTPSLQLNQLEENKEQQQDKSLYYRLGLAGFAFGNIMLLSFPEYLGLEQQHFLRFVGYINILLSVPVLLYAAYDYWHAAYLSIRQKHLSIDVPITLGMLALFSRSVYEIVTHTGVGYLDSLALAGAVTLESTSASVAFMFSFGLGTLPAMLTPFWLGQSARFYLKPYLPYLQTLALTAMGVLLIFRGLQTEFPVELSFLEMLKNPVMCH